MNGATARCWGDNATGDLGNGTLIGATSPVVVSGLTNAAAISAGGGHVRALLGTGAAKCWGKNTSGQLGNGTTVNSSTAVAVTGL